MGSDNVDKLFQWTGSQNWTEAAFIDDSAASSQAGGTPGTKPKRKAKKKAKPADSQDSSLLEGLDDEIQRAYMGRQQDAPSPYQGASLPDVLPGRIV